MRVAPEKESRGIAAVDQPNASSASRACSFSPVLVVWKFSVTADAATTSLCGACRHARDPTSRASRAGAALCASVRWPLLLDLNAGTCNAAASMVYDAKSNNDEGRMVLARLRAHVRGKREGARVRGCVVGSSSVGCGRPKCRPPRARRPQTRAKCRPQRPPRRRCPRPRGRRRASEAAAASSRPRRSQLVLVARARLRAMFRRDTWVLSATHCGQLRPLLSAWSTRSVAAGRRQRQQLCLRVVCFMLICLPNLSKP